MFCSISVPKNGLNARVSGGFGIAFLLMNWDCKENNLKFQFSTLNSLKVVSTLKYIDDAVLKKHLAVLSVLAVRCTRQLL